METTERLCFFSKLQAAKPMSKKIQKYPKYIRKPFLKPKYKRSFTNLIFVEDSISTCDNHSNLESSIEMEEEIPKVFYNNIFFILMHLTIFFYNSSTQ